MRSSPPSFHPIDDVQTKWTLDHRGGLPFVQREGSVIEGGHHLAPLEPPQITATDTRWAIGERPRHRDKALTFTQGSERFSGAKVRLFSGAVGGGPKQTLPLHQDMGHVDLLHNTPLDEMKTEWGLYNIRELADLGVKHECLKGRSHHSLGEDPKIAASPTGAIVRVRLRQV